MTTLGSAWGGDELDAWADSPTLSEWTADGSNTYEYVGSDPVNFGDPEGLFFSFGDLLGGMSWQSEMQADYGDDMMDAYTGIKGAFTGEMDAYALDQWADVHWATDWSQPDDFYRGSASWAMGTGTWGQYWGNDDETSPGMSGLVMGAKKPGFGKGSNVRSGANGGVYLMRNKAGEVVYVGRTVDFDARNKAHKRIKGRKSWDIEILHSNVTADQMRGLEQAEMDKQRKSGAKLKNRIRGVSKNNPNAKRYAAAASRVLRKGR